MPRAPICGEEAISSLMWDYLSCLYKNGQILKDYLLVKNVDSYIAFVTIPGGDALDDAYNNIYVSKYLAEIKNKFEISTDTIGENLNTDKSSECAEKPEWYMLYTDWADEESPVVCGRCGKSVPLYKFPHISGEQEHHGVLGWKEIYRDLDSVWLYCLSDRFTYRQMNNIDSQLSKIGRELCREFETATGIPFYYYLFYADNLSGTRKTPTRCPVCDGDWKLTGEKTFIDYKCDKCRLVADEVSN